MIYLIQNFKIKFAHDGSQIKPSILIYIKEVATQLQVIFFFYLTKEKECLFDSSEDFSDNGYGDLGDPVSDKVHALMLL